MKDMIAKLIKDRFASRNFCTSFEIESDSFDVLIDGLGPIKLPIQPKVAKQLIEVSVPSKFGFKEETLFNPNIRKSFEIEAEKIQLGSVFQSQVNESLARIKKDLLFPATSNLRAELHNMLIYEKGCFFELHQDSEKQDGMMASLVVVLPSTYRGGELVIEYHGHRKELPDRSYYRGNVGNNSLTFMAFYADCFHKIEKLTYGYRIALTFNLILENPQELKSDKNNSKTIKALEEYFATQKDLPSYCQDEPKWFVYLLNHQYTSKSVNWTSLKSVDKEAAAMFKQVAEELELDVYLTLADIQETWNVVDDYYGRYRARNLRYNSNDNVYELELDEVVNSETVLSHWLDQDGKISDFPAHYVHDSMIFMSQENGKYTPESSEYEGYMGNYGNTLDRWYKRTAIVLWPKRISLESKFSIDVNMGIKELINLIKFNTDSCIVHGFIDKLLKTPHMISKVSMEYLIELVILLDDQKYLKQVFANCDIYKILHVNPNKITDLFAHFGDEIVSSAFITVEKNARDTKDRAKAYYDILICAHKYYPLITETLLNLWLEELKHDLTIEPWQVNDLDCRDRYILGSQRNLVFLVEILSNIDGKPKLEKAFNMIYGNKEIVGGIVLYEILHHPVLNRNFNILPEYKILKKEALQDIELILNSQLKDTDWTIDELPKCSCELCLELKKFLSCSSSFEKCWPISKERRQHVHIVIEQLKLPVSHETLRQGSPHRLILKKTDRLLSWRKARYAKLRKLMDVSPM